MCGICETEDTVLQIKHKQADTCACTGCGSQSKIVTVDESNESPFMLNRGIQAHHNSSD